jgi:serine/threonine-protein kinase
MENGTVLDEGRYTILGTLGGGGQGTALRAKYEPARGKAVGENHILKPNFELLALNPDVVIKEYVLPVHRGQLTAQKTAEKLKAEAEILSKIDNPQVVKILDCFVEDYRGFLVLEYVQGDTLQSLVNRLGPQPEDQVVDWALQVCSVLSYLHHLEPPVVHRDITPDNLMLDQNEKIKVVDFNVAYQVDSSATATVVGKHAYIPAEQFRGKPVPQSDIYALGGTLNFLLTGLDPEPITRSHPKIIRPEISQALDDIVAKATSTDLSKRYSDVELLAKDLSALIAQNR